MEYDSQLFSDYEDRYQFFLLGGLLLLCIELLISDKKSRLAGKLKIFKPNEKSGR